MFRRFSPSILFVCVVQLLEVLLFALLYLIKILYSVHKFYTQIDWKQKPIEQQPIQTKL